jgi:hypothetical protein
MKAPKPNLHASPTHRCRHSVEADRLRAALTIAKRLIAEDYIDWPRAGGPNECKHGFAAGIPCRECDREVWAAFLNPQA